MGQSASLARATMVRSARAALRRRMASDPELALLVVSGEAPALDEEMVASLPVTRLLESVPGIGPVTAREILADAGMPEHALVYGLMPERRHALAERVRAVIA